MLEKTGVYRRVVLVQFNDDTPEYTMRGIEDAFGALCQGMSQITDYQWGRHEGNQPHEEAYTHCFILGFSSNNERDSYLLHPAHRAFCSQYLTPHLKKICQFDFQAREPS